MKKNKIYVLIAILTTVLIFGVAAICNQCGAITPATTASTSISDETTSAKTTSAATTAKTTSAATTAVETIGNRNPDIADIIIPGGTLYVSQQYDISASASDQDGDNLTYAWTVSDGSINNSAANPMKWTTPNAAGDYTIQVKVTDGKGGEATKPKTVSVSPPAILSMDVPKVTAEGGYIAFGGIPINAGGCLFAGDEPTNKWVVGYISFDITGLTNATIQNATMTFNVKQKYNDPSFYASFLVYETYWGTVPISVATYSLPVNQIQHIASTTDGNFTVNNAALKTALQTAINADHPRFQIGLSPTVEITNGNNDWDGIEYDQSGITLNVTYTH